MLMEPSLVFVCHLVLRRLSLDSRELPLESLLVVEELINLYLRLEELITNSESREILGQELVVLL